MNDGDEFILLPAGHRLKVWKRARLRMAELDQEKRQLEERLRWIEQETAFQATLVKACEPWICLPCNGQGHLVEWVDQDTKTNHRCKKCNGKGVRTDPPGIIGQIGALEGGERV